MPQTATLRYKSYIPSFFQSYFEDNPRDLQLLRHDKALHTAKVQSHLKNVPEYLSE